MGRTRTVHVCEECGASALRWAGRCAACGAWNSLVEEEVVVDAASAPVDGAHARRTGVREAVRRLARAAAAEAVPLADVDPDGSLPFPTGLGELDRVLAGGLVPGSVTLVGGEPGIGKSTLVLQAIAGIAASRRPTLLVAAEESAEQVRRRASRLADLSPKCYIVATTDLSTALESVARVAPGVVVVDSIQAVADRQLAPPAGSTTQVRECTGALVELAKASETAVVLVGHVTKDGTLAGPRTLEHLVDTVLTFEGDRHHALRLLAATKHRFGPTGEIGLFEMGEEGLIGLEDPSRLLLADRAAIAPGRVIVPVAEGRRPLLVELQALTTEAHGGAPRRVVEGVAGARLALMLAVIERSLAVPTGGVDVFVSTVGAIKVSEPATDLALALCVVSAMTGSPIPPDTVVFGELGLTGELRHTPRGERRLHEAGRLGFTRAIVPAGAPPGPPGLEVHRVGSLLEAATMVCPGGSVMEVRRKPPPGISGELTRQRLATVSA